MDYERHIDKDGRVKDVDELLADQREEEHPSPAHQVEHGLFEIFCDIADGVAEGDGQIALPAQLRTVKNVQTFEAAGILTHDRGLVVTMDDGSAFQISIIRSR